eukprot:1531236-Prorocentrum_lima.AAC.1
MPSEIRGGSSVAGRPSGCGRASSSTQRPPARDMRRAVCISTIRAPGAGEQATLGSPRQRAGPFGIPT